MRIIRTQLRKYVATLDAFSADMREEQHVKYKHLCQFFSGLAFLIWWFDSRNKFLGVFAILRTATISSVISVCPHGTTRLPLEGFP